MKKYNLLSYLVLFVGVFFSFNYHVFAQGSIRPNVGSLSITKGTSQSFSVIASNSAGKVVVSSSNPSVASVSTSSFWAENNSTAIRVNGLNPGTAVITVSLADCATFDGEVLSGSYTVTVNVKTPQTPAPKPAPSNNVKPSTNTNTNTNVKPQNNEPDTRSSNTNIKNVTVGSEKPVLKNGIYYLTVKNSVTDVIIKAEVEDKKSTITGIGKKSLKVGNNNIVLTVTAENKQVKTYTINITRKTDIYYINDLSDALKEQENPTILLKQNDKLTLKDIELIKNSKKDVKLNYIDSNKKVLYQWILDGNNLDLDSEFNTGISFDTNYQIYKASNYADGIYIKYLADKIGEGVSLKIFVGNKFKDNDKINLYTYNNEMSKLDEKLEVKDGYVLFRLNTLDDTFLSLTELKENVKVISNEKKNSLVPLLIGIIVLLVGIISVLGVLLFRKNINNSNSKVSKTEDIKVDVKEDPKIIKTEEVSNTTNNNTFSEYDHIFKNVDGNMEHTIFNKSDDETEIL